MKTTRKFIQDGSRYIYDTGICSYKKGFAQVDTGQEAWYYGLWANAKTFTIISFAEGDETIQQYDDAKEFAEAFKVMVEWYKTNDWTCLIDTMCCEQIQADFEALNLQEFFHEAA